jgi:hypothetical protein
LEKNNTFLPIKLQWREELYLVTHMLITRQRVAKHIPAATNARNDKTSIARHHQQHTYAMTEKSLKEVLSILLAYIHCWAMDVFSMGPRRDYINGTEEYQIITRMKRVLGSKGRRVRLNIECELL